MYPGRACTHYRRLFGQVFVPVVNDLLVRRRLRHFRFDPVISIQPRRFAQENGLVFKIQNLKSKIKGCPLVIRFQKPVFGFHVVSGEGILHGRSNAFAVS